MSSDIRLDECLWIRSKNADQPVFRPLLRSLQQRGVSVLMLNLADAGEVARLRERVWKSDQHVIFQGLLPAELNVLRPLFASRQNFSVMPVDWWLTPFWFSRHATFNIFHTYNGFQVRAGRTPFVPGKAPPWLTLPQRMITYEIQSALLRPLAWLSAPALDLWKRGQRAVADRSAARTVYFPYPIAAEEVPLQDETPRYDFTSMGATMGTWLMRDPFVPAKLNFANLYADRQRLINLIGRFHPHPFFVFDRRRNDIWLPWEELTRVIRQSRFMVCTGGVHLNAIPKFLEYACLGVPMIGASLPWEFPWLEQCMVTLDPMRIRLSELKPRLAAAVDQYPSLRRNCLALRESLLKLYHPDTLLDMLQEQMEGRPIRPGYLKTPPLG
jgi:hypothetical protein